MPAVAALMSSTRRSHRRGTSACLLDIRDTHQAVFEIGDDELRRRRVWCALAGDAGAPGDPHGSFKDHAGDALRLDRAQQRAGLVVLAHFLRHRYRHPQVALWVERDVRLRVHRALPARHLEARHELAVAREYLQASVAIVADVHLAGRVGSDANRLPKLAGLRTL